MANKGNSGKAAAAAAAPAASQELTQPVPAAEAAQSEASPGAGSMIDLSGVDENADAFPVIPRGIYPAVVDEVTYGLSNASGNPMWTWKFEISEGDYQGRKLFFHTPFVENMMPRLKKVLSRIAPELLNAPFDAEQIANESVLVGKECQIRLDIRPYEGKPRNNVRDVLPPKTAGGEASFLGATPAA